MFVESVVTSYHSPVAIASTNSKKISNALAQLICLARDFSAPQLLWGVFTTHRESVARVVSNDAGGMTAIDGSARVLACNLQPSYNGLVVPTHPFAIEFLVNG